MTDNHLPTLPDAKDLSGFMPEGHDDKAMTAYGQQCYAAGVQAERERCAELAEAPRVEAFDPQDDAAAEQMNGLLKQYFDGVAGAIRRGVSRRKG